MGTAAAGTVQLNVRIPRMSKEAGDAVLALMSSSPTQIVRALYDKISHGAKAYEEVMGVLATEESGSEPETVLNRRRQALYQATHLMEDFAHDCGLDPAGYAPMADEEYERALYEEYLEEVKGYAYD